jgi:hypothetical protein
MLYVLAFILSAAVAWLFAIFAGAALYLTACTSDIPEGQFWKTYQRIFLWLIKEFFKGWLKRLLGSLRRIALAALRIP